MRIADNQNARGIMVGVDATGKLKVKASIAGGGSTYAYTPFKLTFDDFGWTATTLSLSTGTQRFIVGVCESVVTSGLSTAVGTVMKSSEIYEFVVGGPTLIYSTASGTTGYGVCLSTGATVVSAGSAAYKGELGEFGIFRHWWDSTGVAWSTGTAVSTAVTQFGSLGAACNAVLLTGQIMVLTS